MSSTDNARAAREMDLEDLDLGDLPAQSSATPNPGDTTSGKTPKKFFDHESPLKSSKAHQLQFDGDSDISDSEPVPIQEIRTAPRAVTVSPNPGKTSTPAAHSEQFRAEDSDSDSSDSDSGDSGSGDSGSGDNDDEDSVDSSDDITTTNMRSSSPDELPPDSAHNRVEDDEDSVDPSNDITTTSMRSSPDELGREAALDGTHTPTRSNKRASTDGGGSSASSSTAMGFVYYISGPPSLATARLQGIAMLRAVFQDPDDEIAKIIRLTRGWSAQHSTNEKCRKVRKMLTGDDNAEQSVPFVIATWCMLGGNAATTWAEKETGSKHGTKEPLTDWGRKITGELEHVGESPAPKNMKWDLCKPYIKKAIKPKSYNAAEALMELEAPAALVLPIVKSSKQGRSSKPPQPSGSPASHSSNRGRSSKPPPGASRKRVASSSPQVPAKRKRNDEDVDEDEDELLDSQTPEIDKSHGSGKGPKPAKLLGHLTPEPAAKRRRAGPMRPAPRSELEDKTLKDACSEFADNRDHENGRNSLWNDVVLVAQKDLQENPEMSRKIRLQVQTLANKHDLTCDGDKWEQSLSLLCEAHTRDVPRGVCPYCPTAYRETDEGDLPCHAAGQYHTHQASLCRDALNERRARQDRALERLGHSQGFTVLAPGYDNVLVRRAADLVSELKTWDNQIHLNEWTRSIIKSAKVREVDNLKAWMLAMRSCLATKIVPQLVAQPSYLMEKIRHEVNGLKLHRANTSYVCPGVLSYSETPGNLTEPEKASWPFEPMVSPFSGSIHSPNVICNLEEDGSIMFEITNQGSGFRMADVCFPVGCLKKSPFAVVVVAYPADYRGVPSTQDRLYVSTPYNHNGHRMKDRGYECVKFDDVAFHGIFLDRDELMLDDVAYFIYQYSSQRLFEALAFAERSFRYRTFKTKTKSSKEGKYTVGMTMRYGTRHECGLVFSLDKPLTTVPPDSSRRTSRFKCQPGASKPGEHMAISPRGVHVIFDSKTRHEYEAMCENQRQAAEKGDGTRRVSWDRIYPSQIHRGLVLEYLDLQLRFTFIGPCKLRSLWATSHWDLFNFYTTGIAVKNQFKKDLPIFTISAIPDENHVDYDLETDEAVDEWLDTVNMSNMGAVDLIPYQSLPSTKLVYAWPWVKPRGDVWLERDFNAYFTVYGGMPSSPIWRASLEPSSQAREAYYFAALKPVLEGRRVRWTSKTLLEPPSIESPATGKPAQGPKTVTGGGGSDNHDEVIESVPPEESTESTESTGRGNSQDGFSLEHLYEQTMANDAVRITNLEITLKQKDKKISSLQKKLAKKQRPDDSSGGGHEDDRLSSPGMFMEGDDLQGELDEKELQISKLKKENSEQTTMIGRLANKVSDLEQAVDKGPDTLASTMRIIENNRQNCDKVTQLEGVVSKQATEIASLRAEIAAQKHIIGEFEEKNTALTGKIDALDAEGRGVQQSLDEKTQLRTALAKARKDLRRKTKLFNSIEAKVELSIPGTKVMRLASTSMKGIMNPPDDEDDSGADSETGSEGSESGSSDSGDSESGDSESGDDRKGEKPRLTEQSHGAGHAGKLKPGVSQSKPDHGKYDFDEV